MYEYSSVSASSYDPAALVAKLNEAAADGWDVVSIVPTGGDVSAFLRRDAAAAEDGLVEETVLDEGIFDEAVAEEAAAEEPVIDEIVVDSWSTSDTAAAAAGAAGSEGSDTAVDEVEVIEVTEAAPVEEPPVDEPAGWAVAPGTSTTTSDTTADEIPVVATGATVEEVAEPAAAEPVAAEPTPAPAPVPEPTPVVTTPAGWYPDPSTRYELRYWDGTQWTEHVARQGQQFTDPPVR